MSKKVGIATVFTGYNYGSALQAYATKNILNGNGYTAELFKLGGSLVKGRDVRLGKLFTIAIRSFFLGRKNGLSSYKKSMSKDLFAESKKMFDDFIKDELCPSVVSWAKLKKMAGSEEYRAFICGSDQVWNSAVYYVDPFYYLQFAPEEKRIAFAPSFGRDFVPEYNRKRIGKYISQIPRISVRESTGVDIVKELTGQHAELLIDPTLVLTKEEWTRSLSINIDNNEKYLLAYFLDMPSEGAVNAVKEISEKYGLKIVGLPYAFEQMPWKDNVISAGPKEFVELIRNASFVCTDSFHGTAFSLNFNVPFYTFERDYGVQGKQSARIESILEITGQAERYEPAKIDNCFDIDFTKTNNAINQERENSRNYILESLR